VLARWESRRDVPPTAPPPSPAGRFSRIAMLSPRWWDEESSDEDDYWYGGAASAAAAAVGDGAGAGAVGGGRGVSVWEARQALWAAAEEGDVAGIAAALATGLVNVHGLDLAYDDEEDHATPLVVAAAQGHLAAFRALVAAGADPTIVCDGESVVAKAVHSGNAALVREAMAAREAVAPSLPPLHAAALIEDDGAAMRAVLAGLPKAMAARSKLLNAKAAREDRVGTALHFAAWCGNAGAVAALLEAGAGVEVVDDAGRTPLLVASTGGNAACVAALVAGGAAVDAADKEHVTPL
jgi:hypothetical protein